MTDLEPALLAAHEAGDLAALVDLYHQAAGAAENAEARGFFLTQAYVFALEANHPKAHALRKALMDLGRI